MTKTTKILISTFVITLQVLLGYFSLDFLILSNLITGFVAMAYSNTMKEVPFYGKLTTAYLLIYTTYLWIKFEEEIFPIYWEKFTNTKFVQKISEKFYNILEKSAQPK